MRSASSSQRPRMRSAPSPTFTNCSRRPPTSGRRHDEHATSRSSRATDRPRQGGRRTSAPGSPQPGGRDTGLERFEIVAIREIRCLMSGHLDRRRVTRPVFETRPWRPRFGVSDRRPSSLALRLALIPATAGLDFLPLPASPPFLAEDKKVASWLPSTACRPLRGAGRAPPVCRQPSRSR